MQICLFTLPSENYALARTDLLPDTFTNLTPHVHSRRGGLIIDVEVLLGEDSATEAASDLTSAHSLILLPVFIQGVAVLSLT